MEKYGVNTYIIEWMQSGVLAPHTIPTESTPRPVVVRPVARLVSSRSEAHSNIGIMARDAATWRHIADLVPTEKNQAVCTRAFGHSETQ